MGFFNNISKTGGIKFFASNNSYGVVKQFIFQDYVGK